MYKAPQKTPLSQPTTLGKMYNLAMSGMILRERQVSHRIAVLVVNADQPVGPINARRGLLHHLAGIAEGLRLHLSLPPLLDHLP